MKSELLSVGKKLLVIILMLSGCALKTKERSQGASSELDANSEEVSFLSDNKEIEELRKNIPEQKKADNDLLRETLMLLGTVEKPPHKHREHFDNLIRRIRNDHQKKMRKAREDYSRKEKNAREDFLRKLKEEREDFNSDKPDRLKRERFIQEQERRRRDFTANERDKRQQFDGDMRQKESDFSALMRDRTNEFYRELKLYEKRYTEWKRAEELKKSKPEPAKFESLETAD